MWGDSKRSGGVIFTKIKYVTPRSIELGSIYSLNNIFYSEAINIKNWYIPL